MEDFAVGDGTSIPKPSIALKKLKIKDEIKQDLHMVPSLSNSINSRLKLFPIEEVSENSRSTSSSRKKRNLEERERIRKMLEENLKCSQIRPKNGRGKFKAAMPENVTEIYHAKNTSEQSIAESIFKNSVKNSSKESEFNGSQKIQKVDSEIESILAYKHNQIQQIVWKSKYLDQISPNYSENKKIRSNSNSSQYSEISTSGSDFDSILNYNRYQMQRLAHKNKQKLHDNLAKAKTKSSASNIRRNKSTSMFGCCPFLRFKR